MLFVVVVIWFCSNQSKHHPKMKKGKVKKRRNVALQPHDLFIAQIQRKKCIYKYRQKPNGKQFVKLTKMREKKSIKLYIFVKMLDADCFFFRYSCLLCRIECWYKVKNIFPKSDTNTHKLHTFFYAKIQERKKRVPRTATTTIYNKLLCDRQFVYFGWFGVSSFADFGWQLIMTIGLFIWKIILYQSTTSNQANWTKNKTVCFCCLFALLRKKTAKTHLLWFSCFYRCDVIIRKSRYVGKRSNLLYWWW